MHRREILLLCSLAGCATGGMPACGPEDSASRVFRAQAFGARVPVLDEPGLVYVVTASPGGPRHATLDALDAEGAVLASDSTSGPMGLPKLAVPSGTRFVRLRARELEPSAIVDAPPAALRVRTPVLNIYANDARDDDGDGVGHALERALGTCDGLDEPACARGPLAEYYKRVPHATRDSDRDGLTDGEELWGVAKQPLLDLPRFGADPIHKDVFVEVDRSKSVEPPGIHEEDLVQVARLFAHGSAKALRNPDGKPGVRMHFDIGVEPVDDANLGLLGDWGGSGQSAGDYKKARMNDFSPVRARYFRYAVLVSTGFGQSSGDSFVINRDWNRVALFAHELAHTLGLRHHGDDVWGAANCKPNHFSIINYAYQNFPEVGFSTGARSMFEPSVNPRSVVERTHVDEATAALLRAPPFELDVVSDGPRAGVDWNRDGRISELPVRAALTWATYKSCDSAGVGRATIAKDVLEASPAVVAMNEQLHTFWIDRDAALAHRVVIDRTAERGCTGREPRRCTKLGKVENVSGLTDLRHIATASLRPHTDEIALAHVATAGQLSVSVLTTSGAGATTRQTTAIEGASTTDAPALAWMSVDPARYGAERVLSVLFRAGDEHGTLMQASALTAAGPFRVLPVLDEALQPITTALAPSIAWLGEPPHQELCGVFVDSESFLRFYCYEPERVVWRDLSSQAFYAGLGPQTGGPVGIAYHRFRTANGTPIEDDQNTRGAVYLSFTEPAPGKNERPDNPQLLISQWLDADHPATSAIDFRWRGNVVNQWTHLAAGTAFTLYEDETLTHLKGAMTLRTKDGPTVELLPMVDGAFDMELRAGDDFEVMERGICSELRGVRACGDRQTGSY